MYRYSVPINNLSLERDDKAAVASILSQMGVETVFCCIGSYHFNKRDRQTEMEALRRNCDFFRARGFGVGAWMWTFMGAESDMGFLPMRGALGKDSLQSICPSDENFRAFAADYLCEVALCGVDTVLYDDDYRYGNLVCGTACFCKNHLAYTSNILGETVTEEELKPHLFSGRENRYRSAWLASKRHYFALFAKEMRAALDRVAPHVRLGICSCFPNWDHDGISSFELAKLLAGNTRPLLRLCGAPYWAPKRMLGNHRLQDTVEVTRMERSFCEEKGDVEILGEGDTYPRPRFSCPASFLEGFDQALRADGELDGMLKYTMDYTSSHRYETGYYKRHLANLPLYKQIDEMFGGKEAVGVRVFEHLRKYEKSDIPAWMDTDGKIELSFFPYASRVLTAASVPTVYRETEGVGIAFGENAAYIPLEQMKNGWILDARAAEILHARGVDVGLLEMGERVSVLRDRFYDSGEVVSLTLSHARKMTVSPQAVVKSRFDTAEGISELSALWHNNGTSDEHTAIGSYLYENATGQRFLVFAFDGTLGRDDLLRNYQRAEEIKDALPFLGSYGGMRVCTSPDLYVLAKQKGDTVAVGLWNFCADSVEEPTITLQNGEEAEILRTIGTQATYAGGTITLSRMEPYGFAAVEYRLKQSK